MNLPKIYKFAAFFSIIILTFNSCAKLPGADARKYPPDPKLRVKKNLEEGRGFRLSEKIKLNLEPTFKYQINTFNNTSGEFKPYFIGIYSGFSYRF